MVSEGWPLDSHTCSAMFVHVQIALHVAPWQAQQPTDMPLGDVKKACRISWQSSKWVYLIQFLNPDPLQEEKLDDAPGDLTVETSMCVEPPNV